MSETSITLTTGAILDRARPITALRCHEGTLWVTARGVAADLLVRTGESIDLAKLTDVCVQACQESKLTVTR